MIRQKEQIKHWKHIYDTMYIKVKRLSTTITNGKASAKQ